MKKLSAVSGQRSAPEAIGLKDFRALQVWSKAHSLTLEIYRLAAQFPPDERYGLTSQLRRCSSSVPSNIAEGCGAGSDAEFARFLQIAMRSACELEYRLLLSRDLGLIDARVHKSAETKTTEVKRMLASLLRKLEPGLQTYLDD